MKFYRYLPLLLLLLTAPVVCEGGLVQLLLPQQLHQLTGSVKIIDARPLEQWQKGHIPGAVSFDWQHNTETDQQDVAYRKLPAPVLAERLGRLGIDEQSRVVIYGDADSSWGGEGWVCWLLCEMGHVGDIYLLAGGVLAWQKLYGELNDSDAVSALPVTYRVTERKELDIETAELVQKQADLQLVDTRSFFEWLYGSIPGAVRIDWTEFYRGDERRPLDREELIALLQANGLDPEKPVVYYCSGGIRSAYAWTMHELAGLRSAKNYEGGMEAWRKLR